jgi:hypothetical protein
LLGNRSVKVGTRGFLRMARARDLERSGKEEKKVKVGVKKDQDMGLRGRGQGLIKIRTWVYKREGRDQ